jgi:hypothetical protein
MRSPVLASLALAAVLLPGSASAWTRNDKSIGFALGVVDPEEIDTALWITLNLRVPLGEWFFLEPELGYWKKTEDFPGGETSLQDLDIGANVLVDLGQAGDASFWAGAGLGAHVLKAEVQVGDAEESESETELGVHILGGIDLELDSDLAIFLAARYDILTQEGDGNFEQAKVYLGLRVRF